MHGPLDSMVWGLGAGGLEASSWGEFNHLFVFVDLLFPAKNNTTSGLVASAAETHESGDGVEGMVCASLRAASGG